MSRKNVIAIIILIVVALVVYMKFGTNFQNPSDYSLDNYDLNEVRK